ncbi:MAG: prolyl oligopeptidase family serine peptidase [Pseudomonadota bacterium]
MDRWLLSLCFVTALLMVDAHAQDVALGYQQPSDSITRIVDAPLTPEVSLSPDDSTLLIVEYQNLPSIAELAEPELKLAGYRIKPANFGPSRGWHAQGLALKPVAGGEPRPINGLPEGARITYTRWSADGRRIAFTNTTSDGIYLWVVDVDTATARRVSDRPLNLNFRRGPQWLSDNETLLVALRVDGGKAAPERSSVPLGPTVEENLGETRPARTYQDLLQDTHDEALFEFYFKSQLALIDLGGAVTPIGEPGLIRRFGASPNGEHVLAESIRRPYSYTVPASRFPYAVALYGRDGELQRTLVEKPLQDRIPLAFGSVETGPRSYRWRADRPATLVWAEALDGGDAGAEAEERDRVFQQDLPLEGAPQALATLTQRYGGATWGNGEHALIESWWWPTRNMRVWHVAPDAAEPSPRLLKEYSWQDRYNDPGSPVTRSNRFGRSVLRFDDSGTAIFLIGDGASDEGDRPFLDRHDLVSGETERLFRSEAPWFERPQDVLDAAGKRILTRREAVETPPNYFIRKIGSEALTQLTDFPHPTPQLAGISKELIRYERDDGVMLTGTLYLPPGYDSSDGPLPTLLWAYPTEYKSADSAGQVTDSPYRFVRVGWWSPLMWLTQGYAVLDDPSMPIIGEGDEEPNDTYVQQLVASAKAAVDTLAARGVSDRDRMAIGGHSYGAFMTANLLAHSDLFAAGIARSGAYNRSLTPFGFQAEERTFWESPEIYFAMSPFMHANKINEPMLMIHGEMDNNSGTFPMQSERMYDAMKALGGTVRLVMLPYESHGYRARESILHAMWETENWLENYVRQEKVIRQPSAPSP